MPQLIINNFFEFFLNFIWQNYIFLCMNIFDSFNNYVKFVEVNFRYSAIDAIISKESLNVQTNEEINFQFI